MGENLRILIVKLRRALAQLPYLLKALALVWAAARSWTLAWGILLAAQGLLPVATVYLIRSLVDRLPGLIGAGAGWPNVHPILAPVALLAGLILLLELLRGTTGWIRTAQAELLKDHITALIHRKSVDADLAFYEWPEYYDHLHRAREEAGYRPVVLLESMGSLFQNGITLIAMGTVLVPFGLWLPGALLVSTLPAFFVVLRFTLAQHEWRQRTTADERRTWYYDWLLTSGEPAVELRLFGLGAYFQSLYQTLHRRLRNERLQLARNQSIAESGAGAVALLTTGGAMAWMVLQALKGMVTLGDLALFYQAFHQGQRLMRSLLENMGHLYSNTLFLGNLFEFLALEPRVISPRDPTPVPQPLREGLCFKEVTFRYPGSERLALRNFNLTIPAGQIAAIVGPNGAGKSTLIKLLCRLYDPDAGRIELDGIDLRDFKTEEFRRLISVLFQQPVHYSATVSENIAVSDFAATPGAAQIEEAAQASGADEIITRLPHRYDSLLGKWFVGGTELSVGEWQRIALARAFLRHSPIILLDEATSAMDSWAEAVWLDRFHSLAAGRTVVMITHRLTTAMRADVIHVMSDGQIVESGSHAELLSFGGRYAQSWTILVDGVGQGDGRV